MSMTTVVRGGTLVDMDTVTQYWPWYAYLGERLRALEIPMWNPYQFSGTPFAADPLSGWGYLPAMLIFTALPMAAAAETYMVVHMLLAGAFAYALGRVLDLGRLGSLAAAVTYEFNGFFYEHNYCCLPYAVVATWLPLALLGLELAIRAHGWLPRAAWWGVSGLAISQILAGWIGQGAYYSLLTIGGYAVYRTVVSPPPALRRIHARILALLLHGPAVLVFGFGLAAASVLPRLEYNAVSNLADGYEGLVGAVFPGWKLRNWSAFLLRDAGYAGGAALALAFAAPLFRWRRHAVPFFAALTVLTVLLSLQQQTLAHRTFSLLPEFERLHDHGRTRITLLTYLGVAFLAGATISNLRRLSGRRSWLCLVPLLAMLVLRAGLSQTDLDIPVETFRAMTLAVLCLALCAWRPVRRFAPLVLVIVLSVDFHDANRDLVRAHRGTSPHIDLEAYFAPSRAAAYLQSDDSEPFRYVGFAPTIPNGLTIPYSHRWMDPQVIPLEVNADPVVLGLEAVQGYNPVHIARYDDWMQAMNGRRQDYHDAEVFLAALDSPLLHMLNTRYLIVPHKALGKQDDVRLAKERFPLLLEDQRADLLSNPRVLPRAWVVHEARQERAGRALDLLGDGVVDPRRTVLLERQPPTMAPAADPSADQAEVQVSDPEHLRVRVETTAPGMVVLSEVYYPAWRAYVDGEPAEVYAANHALRAVPVPAGEHIVDLRYESPALRLGIAITLGLGTVVIALWVRVLRQGTNPLDYRTLRPSGAARSVS